MKRMRSHHLTWQNLLLIGALILISYLLRPSVLHPVSVAEKEKIGFIGDSITHGPKQGTGVVEAEISNLGNKYVAVNKGASGTTSADWQPGGLLFDGTLSAFKSQNIHIVSIMLGTNDARRDRAISPATYKKNIEHIVESLLGSGVVKQVVINSPPYVVAGTGGLWDSASVVRLKLYATQLDTIAQKEGVVRGDTKAFSYFEQRPYQLLDGVHPNTLGAEALGKLWADAYKRAVADKIARRQVSSFIVPSYNHV